MQKSRKLALKISTRNCPKYSKIGRGVEPYEPNYFLLEPECKLTGWNFTRREEKGARE